MKNPLRMDGYTLTNPWTWQRPGPRISFASAPTADGPVSCRSGQAVHRYRYPTRRAPRFVTCRCTSSDGATRAPNRLTQECRGLRPINTAWHVSRSMPAVSVVISVIVSAHECARAAQVYGLSRSDIGREFLLFDGLGCCCWSWAMGMLINKQKKSEAIYGLRTRPVWCGCRVIVITTDPRRVERTGERCCRWIGHSGLWSNAPGKTRRRPDCACLSCANPATRTGLRKRRERERERERERARSFAEGAPRSAQNAMAG